MTPAALIMGALLTPLFGALMVALTGKNPNVREAMTAIATVVTAFFVFSLLPLVLAGQVPALSLGEAIPGFEIAFSIEPLGMLYALVAAALWMPTSAYAVGYMRGHHETHQTRFFVCFALAISAALGIAFARNLFTLFLFYEVLTLSTYPLVTHSQTPEARRAGRIYLGILLTTSIAFLLLAIAWTYSLSGTLEFTRGGILPDGLSTTTLALLLGLFAYGCGKAALMPLHRWLPNAMVAPTPVSALLHAVAVVKAGVFSILKIVVYVFGIERLASSGASEWLMWMASITIVLSSLIAFTKDNLKARLAYSTISQLAYIVLGAALVTSESVLGGGLHIATHAVGKITLFFCAGAILVGAHKKNISEMDGLGLKMPLTFGAFLIAALSIIGLPPLAGSWSKYLLAVGAVKGDHVFFMGVLMVSSLLNIGYLMPIPVRAFFRKPAEDDHHGHHDDHHDDHDDHHDHHDDHHAAGWLHQYGLSEAPMLCVIPLCLTALGCIVLFFYADQVVTLLQPIVAGS